jgi:hypothetical protein
MTDIRFLHILRRITGFPTDQLSIVEVIWPHEYDMYIVKYKVDFLEIEFTTAVTGQLASHCLENPE